MSQPEIEISKRCTSCGASARESAHFCPECGISIMGDMTQPLDEIETETETSDSEKVSEEAVSGADESEAKQTVPLDTQDIVSISDEKAVSDSEVNVTAENQTDAGILWTSFDQNEDEDEVRQQTETSPTVPLSSDTVPLVEPSGKKYKPKSLIEEINEKFSEEQKAKESVVEDISENAEDENKLSAKEKSRKLVEGAKRKSYRMKRLVVKSQLVLDEASPDPSLRFVIVSIVLFLLALVIFIFSRFLK